MRLYALLAATLLTLIGVCAQAHGDKIHVRGTLTSVTASSITIKSTEGKDVEVKLVKATIYTLRANNTDQPAKSADLAVGDIVVVHATQANNGLEADEVKFSVPIKGSATKAPSALS